MRILVTGGKGMLGSDLCRLFSTQHYVVVTDIDTLDVRDCGLVRRTLQDVRPDIVVHLAALTDVDYCEQHPDDAFRTNTIGTQNVALATQVADAVMIYLSTISVFDGSKAEPYIEFDTPNPQSQYSKSKYQGELIVQRLLRRYYVVRAGWMFGGSQQDKKFVAKIISLAREREELKVVNDKFGSPTYTADISQAILNLIETSAFGNYHLVNTGEPASRYEVALQILEYAGIGSCRIVPVCSAEFPLPAPRPRMEAARNYCADLIGLSPMRHWHVALKEYVNLFLREAPMSPSARRNTLG
jgi:dTDP-4-dehydrorhamnose reductase